MADPTISLTSEEFSEWGNSNVFLEYQYMKSYDPYSNVIATKYPHIWLDAGILISKRSNHKD